MAGDDRRAKGLDATQPSDPSARSGPGSDDRRSPDVGLDATQGSNPSSSQRPGALDVTQASNPSSRPRPGGDDSLASIGRFEILRRLGAGGMGVVYLARDPRLDREVAIKVPSVRSGEEGFDRLQREAAAMARLSHPNVLQVYEVGTVGDRLFIVMEYSRGGTLGHWLEGTPATRDVLDAFVDAGRGLAAAHAAGLVHRDFKPENVFRTENGRVTVADFGLARAVSDPERPLPTPTELSTSSRTSLESKLTMTGAALGTPAYMAPEQFIGQADERADQFAFCVSLYEAVCGVHPFGGDSVMQLRDRALAGKLQPPRAGHRLPGWLRAALARGLAANPEDRHPSMQALLDAIRRGRRRTPMVLASAGVLSAVIAAAAVTWAATRTEASEACRGAGSGLAAVWNPDVRSKLTASFVRRDQGAAAMAARTSAAVDAYAQRWTAMRVEACEASKVREEQSESLMDLRIACLERRRGELGALLQLLVDKPEPEVIAKSLQAVHNLPSIDRCADTEALRAAFPAPEPSQTAAVAALTERVDQLDALSKLGRYRQAMPEAVALKKDLTLVDYPPIHAQALLVIGQLEKKNEDSHAEATLMEAANAAARARDDHRLAQSQVELVRVVGHLSGRYEQALALAGVAEASILRAGNDPTMVSELQMHRGSVFLAKGELKQALAAYEQALATKLTAVPADDPSTGTLYQNMSIALRLLEDYERAREMATKARDVVSSGWGEDHPEVGDAINLLAVLSEATGDSDKALDMFREAEARLSRAYGPSHMRVATATNNVGTALIRLGRLDEARVQFRRAYEIGSAALGENHPRIASILYNLGDVAMKQESWDEAAEAFDRTLAILEGAHGPKSPTLIKALIGRGEAALGKGDKDRARQFCQRANELMGDHHAQRSRAQTCLRQAL